MTARTRGRASTEKNWTCTRWCGREEETSARPLREPPHVSALSVKTRGDRIHAAGRAAADKDSAACVGVHAMLP
jgi:hypothetical protein